MRFRPSAAATWMRCTGQPALVESLKLPRSDSWYAAEGRAAHRLAADCLSNDERPYDRIGQTYTEIREDTAEKIDFLVDENMARHVSVYVDAINEAAQGCDLFVEQELDLSRILQAEGEQGGTGDAIVIGDRVLEIHDLKYGQGEPVSAKGNRQLLCYAAGAWLKYLKSHGPFDRIRMVIHQPRIQTEPDGWTITEKALKQFIAMARGKVAQAEASAPGQNLVPGDAQCRWCPAKADCPALEKMVLELAAQEPVALDTERLGRLRATVGMVEDWCKAVCERTKSVLEAGIDVPGWKLVAGRRGARQWVDPVKAEARLLAMRKLKKDQMYKTTLITPTEAQRLLTPARFEMLEEEGFIIQPDGKPTVAPADSKKEGVTTRVAFEKLD